MKILALTVSAGNGHNKAAESIRDYFSHNYENCSVEIFDTLKYINPALDKIIMGSYLKSVKNTPYLYGKLYEYADNEDTVSSLSGFVNDILSIKIKGLIERTNPDLVYCTHPFPIEMLSILKKKHKIYIPTVAILTDYDPHAFWFYNHIDAYVVPHEDLIPAVREKGVPRDSIYPLGIPISDDFLKPIDKPAIMNKFGLLEDKITLLIMGGGLGIGNITKIYKEICFSTLDLQVIICCGNNEKLKNQLNNLKSRTLKNSIILGYTEDVHELMSISDILVTKPGGLTITEALIKNLPIIITSTIPGQEEKNADYLINSGIATKTKDASELTFLIHQLINSKLRLSHMREMAKEKSKPDSTKNICDLMINIIENN